MMKSHAILLCLLYPIQSSSTYRVDSLDKAILHSPIAYQINCHESTKQEHESVRGLLSYLKLQTL